MSLEASLMYTEALLRLGTQAVYGLCLLEFCATHYLCLLDNPGSIVRLQILSGQ